MPTRSKHPLPHLPHLPRLFPLPLIRAYARASWGKQKYVRQVRQVRQAASHWGAVEP
jgi:hypothetical protein